MLSAADAATVSSSHQCSHPRGFHQGSTISHKHTHTHKHLHTHTYIFICMPVRLALSHVQRLHKWQLSSSSVYIFITFSSEAALWPTCKGNATPIVFSIILIGLYSHFTCLTKGAPVYCCLKCPLYPSTRCLPRTASLLFGTSELSVL